MIAETESGSVWWCCFTASTTYSSHSGTVHTKTQNSLQCRTFPFKNSDVLICDAWSSLQHGNNFHWMPFLKPSMTH